MSTPKNNPKNEKGAALTLLSRFSDINQRLNKMSVNMDHLTDRLSKMAELAGRVTASFILLAGLPQAFNSSTRGLIMGGARSGSGGNDGGFDYQEYLMAKHEEQVKLDKKWEARKKEKEDREAALEIKFNQRAEAKSIEYSERRLQSERDFLARRQQIEKDYSERRLQNEKDFLKRKIQSDTEFSQRKIQREKEASERRLQSEKDFSERSQQIFEDMRKRNEEKFKFIFKARQAQNFLNANPNATYEDFLAHQKEVEKKTDPVQELKVNFEDFADTSTAPVKASMEDFYGRSARGTVLAEAARLGPTLKSKPFATNYVGSPILPPDDFLLDRIMGPDPLENINEKKIHNKNTKSKFGRGSKRAYSLDFASYPEQDSSKSELDFSDLEVPDIRSETSEDKPHSIFSLGGSKEFKNTIAYFMEAFPELAKHVKSVFSLSQDKSYTGISYGEGNIGVKERKDQSLNLQTLIHEALHEKRLSEGAWASKREGRTRLHSIVDELKVILGERSYMKKVQQDAQEGKLKGLGINEDRNVLSSPMSFVGRLLHNTIGRTFRSLNKDDGVLALSEDEPSNKLAKVFTKLGEGGLKVVGFFRKLSTSFGDSFVARFGGMTGKHPMTWAEEGSIGKALGGIGRAAGTASIVGSSAFMGALSSGAPDAFATLTGSIKLFVAQIATMLIPASVQFSIWLQDSAKWLEDNASGLAKSVSFFAKWGLLLAGGLVILPKVWSAFSFAANAASLMGTKGIAAASVLGLVAYQLYSYYKAKEEMESIATGDSLSEGADREINRALKIQDPEKRKQALLAIKQKEEKVVEEVRGKRDRGELNVGDFDRGLAAMGLASKDEKGKTAHQRSVDELDRGFKAKRTASLVDKAIQRDKDQQELDRLNQSLGAPRALEGKKFTGRVARVLDGDTVELDDGRKVRIAGINTEEMHDAQGRKLKNPTQRAKDATKRMEQYIGKDVSFTTDSLSGGKDPHGRTLAYMEDEGVDVGFQMLREGLADVTRGLTFDKKGDYLATGNRAQMVKRREELQASLNKETDPRLKGKDPLMALPTKAQPQYSSVEEAYKNIQLKALGEDPLSREITRVIMKNQEYFTESLSVLRETRDVLKGATTQ